MSKLPDTTIVHLHRAPRSPILVTRIDGEAWRLSEGTGNMVQIEVGTPLQVGDTVALAAHGVLDAGPIHLRGGRGGCSHALVSDRAFRPNPSRAHVPQLLLQLAELQSQMSSLGGDPLAVQSGPETPFDRAASSDFARCNLVKAAALEMPEEVARSHQMLPLFVNEDTAFVAMVSLSVNKLRTAMEVLERPVNPHMVEPYVLEELLVQVFSSHQE